MIFSKSQTILMLIYAFTNSQIENNYISLVWLSVPEKKILFELD